MSFIEMFGKVKEVKFTEKGIPFGFRCKAEGLDGCKVMVYALFDPQKPEIAFMKGFFHVDDMPPEIHKNIDNLPKDFLNNVYHMARSKTLYEHTNNQNYFNGYMHFFERAQKSWAKYVENKTE